MMLGFKQWLDLEYGGHTFVFFKTNDARTKANAHYLIESGRTWQIDKLARRAQARLTMPIREKRRRRKRCLVLASIRQGGRDRNGARLRRHIGHARLARI